MLRGILILMAAAILCAGARGGELRSLSFDQIKGRSIFAQDAKETFLGTAEGYLHPNSIANPMGVYGNPAGPSSIKNSAGQYGSQTSDYSAYNPKATKPPIISYPGSSWPDAYLTKNPAMKNVPYGNYDIDLVDPDELISHFSSYEDAYLSGPNLTPFYEGWATPLSVFRREGTTRRYDFTTRHELFAYFGIGNAGNRDMTTTFTATVTVDGRKVYQATVKPPLESGAFIARYDCRIGQLGPGVHTVTVEADSGGKVSEIFETDNRFTKTIRVEAASGAETWALYE